MTQLHENHSEGFHEEHLSEYEEHHFQRRLRLFKRLPVVCGLGFIPLITISILVVEVFGLRSGVGFFSAGVGLLAALAVGVIHLRRKMMSGAISPTRRRHESVMGPRLRAFTYVIYILIIPFVLMLVLGYFWIGTVGLLLIWIALYVIRIHIHRERRKKLTD
ncbi:MAG: hypothetical protein KAR39_12060 [Thermoplasmata archaeon]|nr:hypothetical protein [Thermoplasmata archaeon]